MDDANTFDSYYDDKVLLDGNELVKDVDSYSCKEVWLPLRKQSAGRQRRVASTPTVAFKDKRVADKLHQVEESANRKMEAHQAQMATETREPSITDTEYLEQKTGDTTAIVSGYRMAIASARSCIPQGRGRVKNSCTSTES